MKTFCVRTILFVGLLYAGAALPCSICRCGDQSFFLNNAQKLDAGRLLFAVEHFNTRKNSVHLHNTHEDDHGHGLAKTGSPQRLQHLIEVPESHSQNDVQLSLKYGLSRRVMLMATAPYTFNRISTDEGAQTANGLGDPEVLAIAQLLQFGGAWQLHGLAGGRIPLGASDKNDGAGERLDQHLQTGSGAWAGIFGVQLLHSSGSVPLFFSASYQANGANDRDFAYGNIFRFNVAAQKGLAGALDVIAEINGRVADYDDEGGQSDVNSGGTAVYFSPGLRVRLGGAMSLRSQVQIPALEDLHGVQNEKVNVRTGLMWEL